MEQQRPLSRLEAEEIFNQEGVVTTIYKEKIEALKESMAAILKEREKWRLLSRRYSDKNDWFIDWLIDRTYRHGNTVRRKMRQWEFHLRPRSEKLKLKSFDLEAIKNVPIGQFLEAPAMGGAHRSVYKCVFHNEKTASMVWYKKQNRVHCFGCGRFGSVIDVVMERNRWDFKKTCDFLSDY